MRPLASFRTMPGGHRAASKPKTVIEVQRRGTWRSKRGLNLLTAGALLILAASGGTARAVACTQGASCTVDADCNPTSNQCTKGVCGSANNKCNCNVPLPNGTACNDNNACTSGETCQNGTCGHPTSTVTCTALDQCHVAGTCDPMSGVCSNPNKANGTACNDNNACTTNDTCSNGACVGGPPPNCDDHNVCTTDSCKPASGCAHMNNTLPCDDANACTFPDTCSGGQCTGVTTAACKVTGGGFIEPLTGEVSGMATLLIERGSDPGGKANFGFVVQLSGGQVVTTAPTGNLTYMDHGANVSVKATSLDSLIITATDATFTGTAEVNGMAGMRFDVEAHDGGEPGSEPVAGPDTFSITILEGGGGIAYMAAGPLVGGNIQIH